MVFARLHVNMYVTAKLLETITLMFELGMDSTNRI